MSWRLRPLANSANSTLGIATASSNSSIIGSPRSMTRAASARASQGSRLGEFWKYRVGDYRLVRKIEDARLLVLALRVGHRREVYR